MCLGYRGPGQIGGYGGDSDEDQDEFQDYGSEEEEYYDEGDGSQDSELIK